jgi:osmotically-inducible protein OsmY
MTRQIPAYLGVALGALLLAAPASVLGSVTEAVLQQTQGSTSAAQGSAGSPTTEPQTQSGTYRDASPATAASSDVADRIEQVWAANKDLADADIEARVEGTRVILEGEVAKAAHRQTAERLAKRVKGVGSVDNQIAIRMAEAPTNNEREGTRGSVLAGDVKDTARVTADKTEDAAEKTGSAIGRAAEATRDAVVTGAKKTADVVTNDVPEKIDETWITSKIAGKINADDALEHVDVDVKVNKNVVTISGDVPSASLRDRVLRIARETEGVARVVDDMRVTGGGQ